MIVKILTGLERRVEKNSVKTSTEMENIKRTKSILKNIITEMKNTLEGLTGDKQRQKSRSVIWKMVMENT